MSSLWLLHHILLQQRCCRNSWPVWFRWYHICWVWYKHIISIFETDWQLIKTAWWFGNWKLTNINDNNQNVNESDNVEDAAWYVVSEASNDIDIEAISHSALVEYQVYRWINVNASWLKLNHKAHFSECWEFLKTKWIVQILILAMLDYGNFVHIIRIFDTNEFICIVDFNLVQ